MANEHNNVVIPDRTKYIQPAIMALASFSNVVGSGFAIYAGAHLVKAEDPTQLPSINPFFFTAMATSILYFGANVFECGRIWQQRSRPLMLVEEQRPQLTFVEREDQRRLDNEKITLIIRK